MWGRGQAWYQAGASAPAEVAAVFAPLFVSYFASTLLLPVVAPVRDPATAAVTAVASVDVPLTYLDVLPEGSTRVLAAALFHEEVGGVILLGHWY